MVNLTRWKVTLVALAAVFGILFTLPNLLPASVRASLPGFMPKQTLNLGLDLQGGSYLMYSVDTNAMHAERLTNMVEDVRKQLSDNQIAFTDLGAVNGQVAVRITNPAQVNQALNLLRTSIGAPLASTSGGRDVTVSGGDNQTIHIAFVPAALEADAKRAVDQSIEIIRRRIDQLGTREPDITRQGRDRIVIQAAGVSDPERLKAVIGQTAKLTFQMVDTSVPPEDMAAGRIPPGDVIVPFAQGEQSAGDPPALVLRKRADLSGEMLIDAQDRFSQETGQPIVSFRFNGVGSRRLATLSSQNIGKRFAIVLDNKIITAPVFRSVIPAGDGEIEGNFTQQSAKDLAVLLRGGALPAPLHAEEQRTVGAELGADAVRAGEISVAIGFVAILAFMFLSYGGLFGGISILALLINGLLIIGLMSLTQGTLTLPGIAGLILTLAVAVDANVLIYERMRDEIRHGRSVISAMDGGFSKAMTTIIDANVTTVIAGLIMFQVGTGTVKGFALTLLIGVLTSVFTAVFVTQVLLGWWFRTTRPKTLPIV